jgi:hypothetical protein
MAFKKTNVTLETLTLALAQQFAEMPGLSGERPLRDGRLAFLDKERQEGRFVSPTWAVLVDAATSQRYRVNGQHSSTMLSRLTPENFPPDLLVTVEEFTSTDLAGDAFRIFNLFDHPRAARTNTDVMSLYRALYPELATIDLGLLVALCNGISQYESSRNEPELYQPRERGIYLRRPDVRAFVQWAASASESMHAWMFGKAGVVAEMFSSMQMDHPTALTFWEYTLNESHPDPEHDTRELSRNLKDLAPRLRTGAQDRLQKEAAKYWRRYRRNQTMATAPQQTVLVPA